MIYQSTSKTVIPSGSAVSAPVSVQTMMLTAVAFDGTSGSSFTIEAKVDGTDVWMPVCAADGSVRSWSSGAANVFTTVDPRTVWSLSNVRIRSNATEGADRTLTLALVAAD